MNEPITEQLEFRIVKGAVRQVLEGKAAMAAAPVIFRRSVLD